MIMVARNKEKLLDTLSNMEGDGHSIYAFDLKNIDNIESFLEGIVNKEGKLSGLTHCAGVGDMRPLHPLLN